MFANIMSTIKTIGTAIKTFFSSPSPPNPPNPPNPPK